MKNTMQNNTTYLFSSILCIFVLCSILFFIGCDCHRKEKKECEITWYNTAINLYFPAFDSNTDTNSLKYSFSIQIQIKNIRNDTLKLSNVTENDIFHLPKLYYLANNENIEFLINDSKSYHFNIKPNDSIIIGYTTGDTSEVKYLKNELSVCKEQIKRKIESFDLLFNCKLFYYCLNNYSIKKHKDYHDVFCNYCCF